MPDDQDHSYEVGYGRPPRHTRFRPGQSGNPAGKRRPKPTLSQRLDQILGEKVSVTEAGSPRRLSKQDIILRQMVNKAMRGDREFAKLLLNYLSRQPEDAAPPATTGADDFLMQQLADMLAAARDQS